MRRLLSPCLRRALDGLERYDEVYTVLVGACERFSDLERPWPELGLFPSSGSHAGGAESR